MQDSIVGRWGPEDLIVFGLLRNETSYEWLVNYVQEKSITFDMLYNADEVFQLYGVYEDPTYVVIDREFQIRFRDSDYYAFRINELITVVQELLIQ